MYVRGDLALINAVRVLAFFLGVVVDHNLFEIPKLTEKVLRGQKTLICKRLRDSNHVEQLLLYDAIGKELFDENLFILLE